MKLAILSFAHIHADINAPIIRQMPNAELAAIWDDDRERGAARAAQYGVPFVPDLAELLRSDVDGVLIESENARHPALALQAAAAGKHILCEKPPAVTVADARAMIDAAARHDVVLMTAFPARFSPPVVRAREAVLAGEIGRVVAINGTNRGTFPGGWFADPALAGGGAVMDHTVHVLDLMRWFTRQEPVSVYAEVDRRFHDIPSDDCGTLAFEFSGGAFGTLDTSWSLPEPSFPTWGDVTMEIVGTRGTISLDAIAQNLTLYNSDAVKAQRLYWGSDMYRLMLDDFVAAAGERRPPRATGEDGLVAMAVALAAYRSARSGRTEPIWEPG